MKLEKEEKPMEKEKKGLSKKTIRGVAMKRGFSDGKFEKGGGKKLKKKEIRRDRA